MKPLAPLGTIPRLEFLDAVRGIAAVWVVLYHVTEMPVPRLETPIWARYVDGGHAAPMLFFVASAFSLCYTSRFHLEGWSAFYLRRLFRIAPLFYVMLAVTLWRDWALQGISHTPWEILDNALFTFNALPAHQWGIVLAGWTIGVEMVFYLLFPIFFGWTGNVWRALAFVLGSIIAARVTDVVIAEVVADPETYMLLSFFHHLPTLAFGILAFRIGELLRGAKFEPDIGVALIALSLVLYLALRDGRTALLDPYDWQGVIFAVLIVGLASCPVRIVANKTTVFLGKISYSLYLIHSPIILALMPVYRAIYDWPTPLSFKFAACAGMTLTILTPLSYLSFRLIEEPGIRIGRIFINRRSPTAQVATGPVNLRVTED